MAAKIIKANALLGRADESGLSFSQEAIMSIMKSGFESTRRRADRMGGVITGPAKVYIVVEQEVIVNGD